MTRQACLVIGNIRDGECEGLARDDIDVLFIRDARRSAKIAAAAHVSTVAEYNFDLGYSDELDALVRKILLPYSVKSILNFRERYVTTTADLCSKIGSLRHLHQNVERTLDKFLQRRLFGQSGNSDLHVRSEVITVENLRAGPINFPFPFILKPSRLYSSLFVKCIENSCALEAYLSNELPLLTDYVAKEKVENCQILIEEYIRGSNHSIDCAIDPAGTVTCFPMVDVITGMDIGDNDFHHFARYSPSVVAHQMQQRCVHLAIDAISSLELKGTFAHVELILTERGPRILEIAARPGGNRIHVLRETYGLNLDLAYHHALIGQVPDHRILSTTPFAIITPFSKKKQIYKGFRSDSPLFHMANLSKSYSFIRDGELIGPAGVGYQNGLYIEIKANDMCDLIKDISYVSNLDLYKD